MINDQFYNKLKTITLFWQKKYIIQFTGMLIKFLFINQLDTRLTRFLFFVRLNLQLFSIDSSVFPLFTPLAFTRLTFSSSIEKLWPASLPDISCFCLYP
jgi:hypothetical protein